MGMTGAVGHNKGEHNEMTAKWDTTTTKKWHTIHTQPHKPLLMDCAWNDDNNDD